MSMKKIVLCGGGTAGHILPCVALIPELKKHFDKIYYFGQKNGMEYELVKNLDLTFVDIESVKFSRDKILSNIKIPFVLPKCKKKCAELLKEIAPNVVFSKGGYVSLPVTLACKKLKIPFVIHESDSTMGLANKLVAKSAKMVLTNFHNTYKNEIVVGIPLRDSLFCSENKDTILKSMSLSQQKTVLVMGGSLGSRNINQIIYNSLERLLKRYNVIHITGKSHPSNITAKNYFHLSYTDDIGRLYKVSDIVISRAGATTINELNALNKKAVFIPLSQSSSRGDQIINAQRATKENELFCMIKEEELTPELLIAKIDESDKKRINKNFQNIYSNDKIVDLILSCANFNS